MANPEHLSMIQSALAKKDVSIWNDWLRSKRKANKKFRADLSGIDFDKANLDRIEMSNTDLSGGGFLMANLKEANFQGANLSGSNLSVADFSQANLQDTDLSRAQLVHVNLGGSDCRGANFMGADLSHAFLSEANLSGSNLIGANLSDALLGGTSVFIIGQVRGSWLGTTLVNVDLSNVVGLETIHHLGRSEISISTLYLSGGNIPEVFLRGCGVPEEMITFAKSLVGKPIQYYSAFISYSSQDEHFARRLHNDLQMNGVRVWFAPEDLKIGETIEDSIDQAIRVYDKLIIVLSQNSIERAWVRKEFSKAIEKEKQHGKTVLFPIRLDDSVFETSEQWAYDIRQRHIGDFRNWTNPLLYQNAINRLLKDLNAG